jgi:glutamate 5-kinase
MADHLQVRGHVVIDDGAVEKLTEEGKSLLPIGVVGVQGAFARGEVIACLSAAGREVARGLTNYSSARKLSRICFAGPVGILFAQK